RVRETTTTTQTLVSSQNPDVDSLEENPVRMIPNPAGIVQAAKLRKHTDIHEGGDESILSTQEYTRKVVEDVGDDEDFKGGSWVSAVEFVNANGEDLTLKDLLGTISGTIHYKVVNDGGYEKDITLEASLILQNVLVLPSIHYLNITMRNLVKVFPKDTVSGNGSGVGGSGMLDEEEIIKMLKEEEMLELQLRVGRNVTDQEEHQLRLDEEALILALKEEAREAIAEQEWVDKYR
ncbi:hypothetical protein Tco_0260089, partial [Tanacetum coccineum]